MLCMTYPQNPKNIMHTTAHWSRIHLTVPMIYLNPNPGLQREKKLRLQGPQNPLLPATVVGWGSGFTVCTLSL